MSILLTLAQAATSAPATGQAPQWTDFFRGPLFPMLVGILLLYLWMSRSKRAEQKKRQDMLDALKRGDRVQTIGGILGNVVEAREDRVLVKVDETSNTKVWFLRSAIHRVVEEEKTENK